MIREDIFAKWFAMAPRERDAWVAEVVFGWGSLGDGRMRSKDGFMIRAIPEYTTDISAAWSVFEKLRENWLPALQDCDMFGYRVVLQSDSEYRADVGGIIAPTAPEAICLAAIIAELLTKEVAE